MRRAARWRPHRPGRGRQPEAAETEQRRELWPTLEMALIPRQGEPAGDEEQGDWQPVLQDSDHEAGWAAESSYWMGGQVGHDEYADQYEDDAGQAAERDK